MKKISSLVLVLVFLVVAFGFVLNTKQVEYTKATYKNTIEKSIQPLDSPRAPEKNPGKTKPCPKPPSKEQPSNPGGTQPTDPKPPGDKPPQQPCSCGSAPGTGRG